MQSFRIPATLSPGTTYYWKIISKTMALQQKSSPVWSFTTSGTAPPPTASSGGDIVLYASKAAVLSLSHALHEELRAYGVSVTALCPGPTESEFHQALRARRCLMSGEVTFEDEEGNVVVEVDVNVASRATPLSRALGPHMALRVRVAADV
jgi:short-subunit dehydrogenase